MSDSEEPFDDLFEPVGNVTQAPPAADEQPAVLCPSCGHPNHPANRHCASCGARVAQGPLPVAAQPMIRTTAGSRALIVTAVVIAIVIFIAFLFNIFSGDDDDGTTTSTTDGTTQTSVDGSPGTTTPGGTTVAPPAGEAGRIVPNRVVPSAQLSDFPADNLIDDDLTTMWQVGQEGVGASLTFFFPEPVALERIEIKNLSDRTQFLRNFRVRGLRISPDDTTRSVVVELSDAQETQEVEIETSATKTVRIAVTSTFPAETVDGVVYTELAIEDISFFGTVATGG